MGAGDKALLSRFPSRYSATKGPGAQSGPDGAVMPGARRVPVLEVGGSHVTAALVALERGVVLPGSTRTEPLDPSAEAGQILGAVVACGRSLGADSGDHWGVALPGPFDYERGIALFAGVGKFESLYGVDIRGALAQGLPGPPASITFVNDAEAFMWGERLFGAAAGYQRCVGITLGTGVGSAFFADGTVHRTGPAVPPEGRVDLLEIDGEPLEERVSTRALVRDYARRSGLPVAGAAAIAERARAGDGVAMAVFSEAFVRLGRALRPFLERFGAQVLVVGGAMTGSWDLLGAALAVGLGTEGLGASPSPALVVAAHPLDGALLGAAACAERAARGEREAAPRR